ncbi:MAG: restriction endonuclease subunit S [Anaerolineales bacterium]|nr:restriction endonuclease subunit S [Anaerolineales bacterium]
MRSNYKRIGDHIRQVNVRNVDLKATNLLGINIDKFFMPSVANVVGTDMSTYKIVKNGQFACNRMHVGRDYRLPVALSRSTEDFLVSPAYDVFEIKDTKTLSPEYLMMWFSRKEFDRNAWFYTDADVRGGLDWEAFCDMTLPIPSPDKQHEIVKEYNTILQRIDLNNQLIQKLEETAQAIYKQWFVDFEFPNENGEPYKSAGGEMVESELGEIPMGWEVNSFTKTFKLMGGGTPSTEIDSYWNGEIPFFTAKDVTECYYSFDTERNITKSGLKNCSSRLYPENTTFVVARGATVGSVALSGKQMAMNQSCYAILGKDGSAFFAHQSTLNLMKSLTSQATGATFGALVTKNFDEQIIIEPPIEIVMHYEKIVGNVYKSMLDHLKLNLLLMKTKNLLLSKLATVTD